MTLDWQSPDSVVIHNPYAPEGEFSPPKALPAHVWLKSSGTSGGERFVGLSKRALLVSAEAVNSRLAVGSKDVWLNVLPTFHVGGLSIYARSFLSGFKVVDARLARWSAIDFIERLGAAKATLTSLVPTQVYDIVEKNLSPPSGFRTLVVGGGHLSEDLHRRAQSLGWPIVVSYGMTECASQIATSDLGLREMKILRHIEAKVSEGGILAIKSEALLTQYAQYNGGLWNFFDPKKEGWLHTEDRAAIVQLNNLDRALIPLGRVSDQVKISGELVSLYSLQSRLEAVAEPGVWPLSLRLVAIPHARLENQIILVGERVRHEDLKTLAQRFNEGVSGVERIRKVLPVDILPRTELGKVRGLVELVKSKISSAVTLAMILVAGLNFSLTREAGAQESLKGQHPLTVAQRLDEEFDSLQADKEVGLRLEERSLLRLYSGELYGPINKGLRLGELLLDQGVKGMACQIDRVISRMATRLRGFYVYRGGSFSENSEVVGAEFVDQGFVSTSLSKSVATKFSSFVRGPSSVDEISFAHGSVPGFWIDAISAYREAKDLYGSEASDLREYELLLQRNLRFRVLEVEAYGAGHNKTLRRKLEVLGPGPKTPALDCETIDSAP